MKLAGKKGKQNGRIPLLNASMGKKKNKKTKKKGKSK